MAQFRLEVKIHKRGANGSGIMQKAGYNARQALYDDEIGLKTKLPNSKKVEEICFQKIYLPQGADAKFADRTTLWNEVQKVERAKGSQMAREFVGNLPLDHMLPLEESKKILDEFARYLAEQGMICDVALHYKKSNINFHILCPLRKLKPNGKEFAPKRANAYVCKNSAGQVKNFLRVNDITKYNNEHNEDYKRIPLLDKKGNQKMRKRKGRKPTPEWERQPIDLTGWNDAVDQKSFFNKRKQKDTNVEKWRQKLCEIGNKYLSEQEKWEHKSYKRQGLNRIPTIHEGARVQYLEQKEQHRIAKWNKTHPNNRKEYNPVTTLRKQNITIKQKNKILAKLSTIINTCKQKVKNNSIVFKPLKRISKTNYRKRSLFISNQNTLRHRKHQYKQMQKEILNSIHAKQGRKRKELDIEVVKHFSMRRTANNRKFNRNPNNNRNGESCRSQQSNRSSSSHSTQTQTRSTRSHER